MRLWTDGKVIIEATDEEDRDKLISELGLIPINPNPDKTLDEIIKILQKAYPNINISLSNSWHELWEGETIKIKDDSKSISNSKSVKDINNDKRGLLAELKEDKWVLTEP
jgi:transposase-like protein